MKYGDVKRRVSPVSDSSQSRSYREIIGGVDLPLEEKAREVVVEYDDGTVRREIEVVRNGRYVPRFQEMAENDE
ncbi:hypothetical protein [Haloprofundus halobius]|uniref:hypothetical protein n=1 Tax=Haloprofundus halobius TaxID=2876194 RepID=UPI001CCF4CD0|nr:hypothetical protein [Haloprofundus halobius]